MNRIADHFIEGFREARTERKGRPRRIGAELKFPLVLPDGSAVPRDTVDRLWDYLCDRGWSPRKDALAGKVVGATEPGEQNDTLAGCETGFAKIEFSLAHVADLHALQAQIERLRALLRDFSEEEKVYFLAHGIHPMTQPGNHLLIQQGRTAFWEKAFRSNEILSPEEGDDVHLFTINTANQVHVDVDEEEAVDAVNALNGFAGAQIALTAHSQVWKGEADPKYRCVAEMFWDWWKPAQGRTGVPVRPFRDLADYADTIASFSPVYVKREGSPLGIMGYESFKEFYAPDQSREAVTVLGERVPVSPRPEDIDQHLTFQWFSARISRYFTVENRMNDQQPPEEMATIAALTLGLVSDLEDVSRAVERHDWDELRLFRTQACQIGLSGKEDGAQLAALAEEMLCLAEQGLLKRGRKEEKYLRPLFQRLREKHCPAEKTVQCLETGGMEGLVRFLSI